MKHLIATLALSLFAALPAQAAPFTTADRVAIAQELVAFDAALEAGDMDRVLFTPPPQVLGPMAAGMNMDEATFAAAKAGMIENFTSTSVIASMTLDTDAAVVAETGTGLPYMQIPTETTMTTGTDETLVRTTTIAFVDDGTAHLARIDSPVHFDFLMQAFAQFEGVTAPDISADSVQ